MEGGIRRLSWSWDSTLLLALLAWAYPLSISTQHYVCGPPLLYQRGGMEASVSAFHSSPPPSFFKELGRLRLTLFATDNMYADMEVPFHVTVKVEDAASDELISGAYVVVRAEYFGGDGEPWVENFTATEDPPPPPGYYSAFIHHTGAGLYNFTAFVWAEGYEPAVGWITRIVQPARTGWTLPSAYGMLLSMAVLLIVVSVTVAIVSVYDKRGRKRRVKAKRKSRV